mmetsp:Transcript_22397/g.70263  ORF Transcript_22397/g.70263 Transcript_22397/m.70263 type:complete len:287 (-) Transcript_22397:595-1455(-)
MDGHGQCRVFRGGDLRDVHLAGEAARAGACGHPRRGPAPAPRRRGAGRRRRAADPAGGSAAAGALGERPACHQPGAFPRGGGFRGPAPGRLCPCPEAGIRHPRRRLPVPLAEGGPRGVRGGEEAQQRGAAEGQGHGDGRAGRAHGTLEEGPRGGGRTDGDRRPGLPRAPAGPFPPPPAVARCLCGRGAGLCVARHGVRGRRRPLRRGRGRSCSGGEAPPLHAPALPGAGVPPPAPHRAPRRLLGECPPEGWRRPAHGLRHERPQPLCLGGAPPLLPTGGQGRLPGA